MEPQSSRGSAGVWETAFLFHAIARNYVTWRFGKPNNLKRSGVNMPNFQKTRSVTNAGVTIDWSSGKDWPGK
jgi:hypothetical protein